MTSKVIDNGGSRVDDLLKRLGEKYVVKIGLHAEEGAEPKKGLALKDGVPVETSEGTLIDVAEKHEFGIGVPRRSFVSAWFDQTKSDNESAIRKIAQGVIDRGASERQALDRFAAYAVGQMQQRIAEGIAPELSPARKEQKRLLTGQSKDTPLILTGQLRSSLRGKVVENA